MPLNASECLVTAILKIHPFFSGQSPAYQQNIHRTSTPPRSWSAPGWWGNGDQMACKPGSVPPTPRRGRDDHSSGPPVAGRFSRPTRAPGPAKPANLTVGATPLFGLAPGGACHAVPVTRSAVGSYPTLSPLPAYALRAWEGGLLSVALSLGSPPAGVTRRLFAVEPGLSSPSPSPTRGRPPGHLIRNDGERAGRPRQPAAPARALQPKTGAGSAARTGFTSADHARAVSSQMGPPEWSLLWRRWSLRGSERSRW